MPRVKREVPIDRYVAMTLAEIARELRCTPQAVRCVEKNALAKLRKAFLAQRVVTREGRYDGQ